MSRPFPMLTADHRVPFPLWLCPHLLFSGFCLLVLIIVMLMRMNHYLAAVLTWILSHKWRRISPVIISRYYTFFGEMPIKIFRLFVEFCLFCLSFSYWVIEDFYSLAISYQKQPSQMFSSVVLDEFSPSHWNPLI